MSQAPNTVELDEHLREVVTALHRAVNYATPHVGEPKIVDKAIRDCKEILEVVMEGNVAEWVR